MREIDNHKINDLNEKISVYAKDDPGESLENHRYKIEGPKRIIEGIGNVPAFQFELRFQKGPINKEINGITNESILAVLIDRLLSRQKGRNASRYNMLALEACYAALRSLDMANWYGPQAEWVNTWDRFTCSKCKKNFAYTFDTPLGTASYPQSDGTKQCCECGRETEQIIAENGKKTP